MRFQKGYCVLETHLDYYTIEVQKMLKQILVWIAFYSIPLYANSKTNHDFIDGSVINSNVLSVKEELTKEIRDLKTYVNNGSGVIKELINASEARQTANIKELQSTIKTIDERVYELIRNDPWEKQDKNITESFQWTIGILITCLIATIGAMWHLFNRTITIKIKEATDELHRAG